MAQKYIPVKDRQRARIRAERKQRDFEDEQKLIAKGIKDKRKRDEEEQRRAALTEEERAAEDAAARKSQVDRDWWERWLPRFYWLFCIGLLVFFILWIITR